MRIKFGKMKKDDLQRRWQDAMCFLNFTVESIRYMLHIGGIFAFEHPTGASSWKVPGVQEFLCLLNIKTARFYLCRFGLKAPVSKKPIRKYSKVDSFLTNSAAVFESFDQKLHKCKGANPHNVIEGSDGFTVCPSGVNHILAAFAKPWP